MNRIAAFSPFHQAVSVVLLALICLTVIPNVQAQASGITSILDLQYPSQAALQNGVAQVTVTFTVYYNYYRNPQGYLVFGIYDSRASNYAKGSATATPDQCQKLADAQYTKAAICAIVPGSISGRESALFTLTFNSPQANALSAVTFIWDSRNLQSGNQVSGSDSKSDFMISVTGQTVSTSSTTASSLTTSPTTISSTTSATATTSLTTGTIASSTTMSTLTVQSPTPPAPSISDMFMQNLWAVLILFAVVLGVLGFRLGRRGRKGPSGPSVVSAPSGFCTSCGAALAEGAQFCPKCGAKRSSG